MDKDTQGLTARTLTVVEFLTDRWDEDAARLSTQGDGWHRSHGSDLVGTFSPRCQTCLELVHGSRQRGLAEVAAKRRILAMLDEVALTLQSVHDGGHDAEIVLAAHIAQQTLLALASVHADHPDFDPRWTH